MITAIKGLSPGLENLYLQYNDPKWLRPDPLAIALEYRQPRDLELAALLAAALALGNASLIEKAVLTALAPFGPNLSSSLYSLQDEEIKEASSGFIYRFFGADDIAALLCAARTVQKDHGSLENAFLDGHLASEADYAMAASRFVKLVQKAAPWPFKPNLLPDPAKGSAAKRLFLYLRWMVRKDAIDPGPWTRADPALLLVPLDTHMASACRRLGLLKRRSTDLKAAREASAQFRLIRPDDPLRYDFCMTRPGIRPDLDPDKCFAPFIDTI